MDLIMGQIANAKTAMENARAERQEKLTAARGALVEQVTKMRAEFEVALPPGRDIELFMRDARTVVQRALLDAAPGKPSLLECTSLSVLGALMNCAQLGLRPGVRGQGYLVVRWSGKWGAHVASFDIGYKGLVKLAYESGAVSLMYAGHTFADDEWSMGYCDSHHMRHIPGDMDDPGDITRFYAYAKLTNGETVHDRWLQSRMIAHREKFAPRDDAGEGFGPWWGTLTYPRMGEKTMLRQLSEQLPQCELFAEASDAVESIRVEPDPDARPSEVAEFETSDGAVADSEHAPEIDPADEVPQTGEETQDDRQA